MDSMSILRCPKCGGAVHLRHGPYGDWYGCNAFPRCRGKLDAREVYAKVEAGRAIDRKRKAKQKREAQIIAAIRKINAQTSH